MTEMNRIYWKPSILGAPYGMGNRVGLDFFKGIGLYGYVQSIATEDGPEVDVIRRIRASHPFTLAGERRALELAVMLESAARIEHACHFDDLDSEGKEKVRQAVAMRCARLGLA